MYNLSVHNVLDTIESAIHHIVAPFHHKPRYERDLEFERKVFLKTASTTYTTPPHDIHCGNVHFVGAQERCPYSRKFVDPASENWLEKQRMERRRAQASARNSESGVADVGGVNLSSSAPKYE